eukprot:TRINITY_DN24949_c0_g1_i1.p1 TRINITY_DN24949_c0_g1~~TRINITY_DN24949_c0_g1_i1.p1  ORF type:complete len:400 (+),score=65.38 TRINITY_DN24949_c0_g1_i1:48-1202(+)
MPGAGKIIFFSIAVTAALTAVSLIGNTLTETEDGWVMTIRIPVGKTAVKDDRPTNINSTSPSPAPTQHTPPQSVGSEIQLKLHPAKLHSSCPPRAADEPEEYPENGVKMCPIPGLNNLLYTQVNRYYCAARDRVKLNLRDRLCMKYSKDWFRYSEILDIEEKGGPPVCFGSNFADPEKYLKRCEWKNIREWYGSRNFWAARKKIAFNKGYMEYAEKWLEKNSGGSKFLAIHVRRGDYFTHCKQIAKKKEPAWHAFSWNKAHKTVSEGGGYVRQACYPTMEEVAAGIDRVVGHQKDANITSVFVSSNDKDLIKNVSLLVSSPLSFFQLHFPNGTSLRGVDQAIIDMVILSKASSWILNRYSSFSATPYELAYTDGRVTVDNLWWW